ncbi:hypothetical protein EBZ37_12690 [bacterium]|nr:hypothetical protein [bacterium]
MFRCPSTTVIRMITSSNLMDEIAWFKPIHDRTLLKDLFGNKSRLKTEIALLEEAIAAEPSIAGVRNAELRAMLEVTSIRMRHALAVRKIILGDKKKQWAARASGLRSQAFQLLKQVKATMNRYPQSLVFRQGENVTSYDEGYGATAVKLHFWEREELMAQDLARASNPFFMNMYNVWKLLF